MISRYVMAIVLAGASSLAQAQPVRPEATSLTGSERYGIKSQAYGKYDGSFRLARVAK